MIIKYDALYSPDDANVIVGLKVPDGVEPNNALVSGGDLNIGWTSGGVLPRVNTANMLSYSRTEYDVGGRVQMTVAIDEAGYERPTSYEYDKAGKQTAVIDPNGHDVTYVNSGSWHVIGSYTLNGRDRTTTHYSGTMRDYVTDARNNTTSFTYDALGRVTKTTYPAASPNPVTYVHTHYDKLGRKDWESEQTTEDSGQITGATKVKTFEYDVSGNLVKVRLPQVPNPDNGNQLTNPEFRYVYDIYGNQVAQLDPNNQITIFRYNELDLQTHKYEPFEVTGTLPTTAAEVYAISLAGKKYEETTYDVLGRVRTVKDYKGQVKILDYNICGQPEFVRYYVNWATLSSNYPANGEPNMHYTYDNLGRKDKIYRNSVEVQDFDYDVEGRIIAIDTPQGSIGYKYDTITGRKTFVYEPADNFAGASNKIEYAYDELGRLKDVNIVTLNNYSWTLRTRYSYNEVGALASIRHVNGNFVEYTYDSLNRITKVENWQQPEKTDLLSRFAYVLNPDGMRDSVTETFGTNPPVTINWTYDNLNRLTREESVNNYTYDYTYDLANNRRSWSLDGDTLYYSYNARDELLNEIYDGQIFTAYQYDDNGSLRQKSDGGATWVYGYNLLNQLESVTLNGTDTTTYSYNPDGSRVRKDDGANPIDYLLDPFNPTGYPQVFVEDPQSGASIVYVIGNDVLSQATNLETDLHILLRDGHSSVRQFVDLPTLNIESCSYDAYGNGGGLSTKLLYTGGYYDNTLQYYLFGLRPYNTWTGLFTQKDPYPGNLDEPLTLHKYIYCGDNPVNFTDPTGMFFSPSNLVYGNRVHKEIGIHFKSGNPRFRFYDRSIKRILGLPTGVSSWGFDRPDLVDTITSEVYEIKPSGGGVAGAAQLGWYLVLLNTNDPLKRVWKPGVTYMPQSIIMLDAFSFAIVKPPRAGVITYQVVDTKPAIAAISAYMTYRLMADVAITIQLKTLVPALP